MTLKDNRLALNFKVPQFNGQDGIEWSKADYFIFCFEGVAGINKQTPGAALLYLKQALKDSAVNCGKAARTPALGQNRLFPLCFEKRINGAVTRGCCRSAKDDLSCLPNFTKGSSNRNNLGHVLATL